MNKITEVFQGLTSLQKILVLIILATSLFAGSTTIAYSVFSKIGVSTPLPENGKANIPTPSSALVEDPAAPKTEACPLNGELHTKKAKEFWEKRRRLAVMIENHTEARPQSGLSNADIVY